eukprot:gene21844-28874_t
MNAIHKASVATCTPRVSAPRPVLRFTPTVRPVAARVERMDRNVRMNFFKFGKNGMGSEAAGIYGAQGKGDYDADDLEQYFNYMGFLAEEGTYDRMEKLSAKGLIPIDAILILAASENDFPKIQEILKAGANPLATDCDGKTPMELCSAVAVKDLLKEYEAKVAAV